MRDPLEFNSDRGDRIARKPGTYEGKGLTADVTSDLAEAITYARWRAIRTGKRQRVSIRTRWFNTTLKRFHVQVLDDRFEKKESAA